MTGNPPVNTPIGRTVIDRVENRNLFLHFAIQLPDGSTVGDETLRLVEFSGNDAVSDHFQYQLELHGNSDPAKAASPNLALRFDQLIGRPITVAVNQPNKAGAKGLAPASGTKEKTAEAKAADEERESCQLFLDAVTGNWPTDAEESAEQWFTFFNGIVASFAMGEPGVYQLTMRPAAWRPTLTNRYRIHEQRNIRDAIAKVLEEHHVEYSMDAVSGDDNPALYRVQDWLQAGESDYDFIHRLMGKAHIYYYYVHLPDHHILVFANRPEYPDVYNKASMEGDTLRYERIYDEERKLRYAFSSADPLGMEQEDTITQYRFEQSLTASGVDGVLSRQQAAWEEETVAVPSSYRNASDDRREKDATGELPFHRLQILQYGGSTDQAKWETQHTAHSLHTSATSLSGGGHCARFRAGHSFRLEDAASPGVNPEQIRPTLPEEPFVLTRVEHKASLDGGYNNQFQASRAVGLVAPFSIQDTQQGSVMAVVVHVDNNVPPDTWKYYYTDNFDPVTHSLSDSHCPDDEKSRQFTPEGVYVRFVTDPEGAPARWVRLAPHMQTAPEIGVTVMVSRSYYADELPEIQSIVQNNGHKTVVPKEWTANTSVGNNYSTNYGDSMSSRFGADSTRPPGVAVTFSEMDHPVDEFRDESYTARSGAASGDRHTMLDTAVKIVEDEYKTKQYRDSSYSQGASYSFSTAEEGKSGLLSRSDSFGSTYSHHEGENSKSYSEIDHNYSKSVMIDVTSYTEIDKKSYSESTIGESENITHIVHDSTSTNTVGGDSVNDSTVTGDSTNTSTVVGTSTNTSTVKKDSINTSTVNGKNTNTSTVDGDSDNTSTVKGKSTNTSTVEKDSINTSTVNGKSVNTSTVDGDSDNTSTVKGKSTNDSTVNGDSDNTSTVKGDSTNTSTVEGTSNNTNNVSGSSFNYSDVGMLSFNKSTTLFGVNISGALAQTSTNGVAASNSNNFVGTSNDISIVANANSFSYKGVIFSADITSTGIAYQNDTGVMKLGNKGTDIEMVMTIEIIM